MLLSVVSLAQLGAIVAQVEWVRWRYTGKIKVLVLSVLAPQILIGSQWNSARPKVSSSSVLHGPVVKLVWASFCLSPSSYLIFQPSSFVQLVRLSVSIRLPSPSHPRRVSTLTVLVLSVAPQILIGSRWNSTRPKGFLVDIKP
jgi:hypothetical protein